MIDQRAVIHPSAKIADNVTIGPFSCIGADVEIGEGTVIGPNVVIDGPTKIGKDNRIYQYASIGSDAQDLKFKGEPNCRLEIGDRNRFREFCTINRGTAQDRGLTKIGSDNTFLAYSHVAHDCLLGDHIILSNNATLAGHITVEDWVIISGFVAIHQFCRIGAHSFLGGGAHLKHDILPFLMVADEQPKPYGLNTVGLSRRGFDADTLLWLKRAYKIIYRQNLRTEEAIEQLKEMVPHCQKVQDFIDFLGKSERGILRG